MPCSGGVTRRQRCSTTMQTTIPSLLCTRCDRPSLLPRQMSWLLIPAACTQPTHVQVLDLNAAGLSEQNASLNVLPAGGFSLHDVYLVHNSRPNKSLKRRAGYVMRYAPTHQPITDFTKPSPTWCKTRVQASGNTRSYRKTMLRGSRCVCSPCSDTCHRHHSLTRRAFRAILEM